MVYVRYRHPENYVAGPAVKSDTVTILCLGDSFTEGNGAAPENSYPAQLGRLLQEKGYTNAKVVNKGRGGETSSLLLSELKGYLAACRPHAVLILVGCNNTWNLEKSSYFLLADRPSGLSRRLDRVFGASRVYKLCKISWLNFAAKIRGPHKAEADGALDDRGRAKERVTMRGIAPASQALFHQGLAAYAQGDYDSAVQKFRDALIADSKNYTVHLWLSHLYKSTGNVALAREQMRQAVDLVDGIDAWQYSIYEVVNRFRLLGGGDELRSLKAYLQGRYGRERTKSLVSVIDGAIRLSTDQEVFRKVLEYDFTRVVNAAREEGVAVLLQTYPRALPANIAIRAFAGAQGTLLIDHQALFEGKIPAAEREGFFVSDGHCNARGYQLMAAHAYDVLVAAHVLAAQN
jgi:lysophospholipase L1-like esterase